jgi:hypothetical protein
MTSSRVFISYALDSDAHQEAVRDLWILLRVAASTAGWTCRRLSVGGTGDVDA